MNDDITEACLQLLKDMYKEQMPDKLYRVKNEVKWDDAVNASNRIIEIIKKNSRFAKAKVSIDNLIARDLDLIITIPRTDTFTVDDDDMPDFKDALSNADYLDVYINTYSEMVINIGFRKVLNSHPSQQQDT